MYKILTVAALLFICMLGGVIAGEQAIEVEEVSLVRPEKERPVAESELARWISDNMKTSQHYDRNDPQVVFGAWINYNEYPGVQPAK